MFRRDSPMAETCIDIDVGYLFTFFHFHLPLELLRQELGTA